MSNLIPMEHFLLRRTAAEQRKVAESMRGMVRAVGAFVEVVDRACETAKVEVAEALVRTSTAQRQGASERARSMAALETGDLDAMIAERDRLLAEHRRPSMPSLR